MELQYITTAAIALVGMVIATVLETKWSRQSKEAYIAKVSRGRATQGPNVQRDQEVPCRWISPQDFVSYQPTRKSKEAKTIGDWACVLLVWSCFHVLFIPPTVRQNVPVQPVVLNSVATDGSAVLEDE